MESDSSEPEAKEASSNKKKFVQSTSMLEKLAAMNATKTKLRQYNLAIIITVDTIHSSAGRAYFDNIVLVLCNNHTNRDNRS